jgi:hypothetical protein
VLKLAVIENQMGGDHVQAPALLRSANLIASFGSWGERAKNALSSGYYSFCCFL